MTHANEMDILLPKVYSVTNYNIVITIINDYMLNLISASFGQLMYMYTVEPPNKGHVGDNIDSAVVTFVERLSSSRRFKM